MGDLFSKPQQTMATKGAETELGSQYKYNSYADFDGLSVDTINNLPINLVNPNLSKKRRNVYLNDSQLAAIEDIENKSYGVVYNSVGGNRRRKTRKNRRGKHKKHNQK
jgi:hypothetical protein